VNDNVELMPGIGRSPDQLLRLALDKAGLISGIVVLIDWGDSTQTCWSNIKSDRFALMLAGGQAELIRILDQAWEPGSPLDGVQRNVRMTQGPEGGSE